MRNQPETALAKRQGPVQTPDALSSGAASGEPACPKERTAPNYQSGANPFLAQHLFQSRESASRAIIAGEAGGGLAAAHYPDLVQLPNAAGHPAWLIALLRRPVKPLAGRYIIAAGELFHVEPLQNDYQVARVRYFEPARKPVHQLLPATAPERARAIEVYRCVAEFVEYPGRFAAALLRDLDDYDSHGAVSPVPRPCRPTFGARS